MVYDFDSLSSNDFIGQVMLPLSMATSEDTTVVLQDQSGRPERSFRGPHATLTYRVRYRTYPESSRLAGAWCVTIVRADHLPARDKLAHTSDPFALLLATSRSVVRGLSGAHKGEGWSGAPPTRTSQG